MRFAKISFDLWGALSPTSERPPESQTETAKKEMSNSQLSSTPEQCASAKRSMSQAELESSLFKV